MVRDKGPQIDAKKQVRKCPSACMGHDLKNLCTARLISMYDGACFPFGGVYCLFVTLPGPRDLLSIELVLNCILWRPNRALNYTHIGTSANILIVNYAVTEVANVNDVQWQCGCFDFR